jgi:hypothetical protein
MPRVSFDQLPDGARVWVFASDRALTGGDATRLLEEVDRFLDQWKAHGTPLRGARDWRDDRFLAIGVDPTVEQASGCSIDGLFRGLRSTEQALGTRLVAGGRIFYRDSRGQPQTVERRDVASLADEGKLTADTPIFDTSVTSTHDWRLRFEVAARDSWVGSLLSSQASQDSSRAATKSSSVRNG